jgi:hypothetical protein
MPAAMMATMITGNSQLAPLFFEFVLLRAATRATFLAEDDDAIDRQR